MFGKSLLSFKGQNQKGLPWKGHCLLLFSQLTVIMRKQSNINCLKPFHLTFLPFCITFASKVILGWHICHIFLKMTPPCRLSLRISSVERNGSLADSKPSCSFSAVLQRVFALSLCPAHVQFFFCKFSLSFTACLHFYSWPCWHFLLSFQRIESAYSYSGVSTKVPIPQQEPGCVCSTDEHKGRKQRGGIGAANFCLKSKHRYFLTLQWIGLLSDDI